MSVKAAILLGVVSLCFGEDTTDTTTTEDFSHSEILDSQGKYILFWKYNDTHITFEVHVDTKGRVGFGLFPDVVIGWVSDDGIADLSDQHVVDGKFVQDVSKDWHLLYGEENQFGTVLKFVRNIDTCDKAGDKVISRGLSRLIYAYWTEDPTSDVVTTPHSEANGTKLVALFNNLPTDVETYDILNQNFTLTSSTSTYWCIGLQMPDIGKHHIIKYEPVITLGNEIYVEHMVLFRCKGINSAINDGARGNCYDIRPDIRRKCSDLIITWFKGGKPFYFPEHVGISIGAPDDDNDYVLMTHYHNPTKKIGIIDHSGIRLTLTKTLRPQEAGLLTMGVRINLLHMIPPHQETFVTKGYCSANCIRDNMAAKQIPMLSIFSVLPHLTAVMTIRHYRKDAELEPLITYIPNSHDFKDNQVLHKERKVHPGDSFRVDCTYDSRSRSQPTFGGLSVYDELCFTYAYYYPRIPLTKCYSMNTFDAFSLINHPVYDAKLIDWTNNTYVREVVNKIQQSNTMHFCQSYEFTANNNYQVFLEKDDQAPYVAPPAVCN